jgi:hypothetical protein
VPVGIAPPEAELATVTVTFKLWFDVMLDDTGVTVTFAVPTPTVPGQAFTTFATLSDPRPVA